MKRIYLLSLSFALCATSTLLADGPTFTQIDFPGSIRSSAWGINANGDIVGSYTGSDNSHHGYLMTRGEFLSIDYPGAAFTAAIGISSHGDVVGQYAPTPDGSGPNHAFLLSRSGVFSTVDFPGALSSAAVGINSRGDILGEYSNSDGIPHTYVMNADPFSPGGQYKAIADAPGDTGSVPIGIRGDDIVGAYYISNDGFLLADGRYTKIDVPGATFTNVSGIDARGQMVGRSVLNGVSHGYLMSGGQVTNFDFPGAIFTAATAISPTGEIVGRYQDANKVNHGFLLTGFRLANQCAANGQ